MSFDAKDVTGDWDYGSLPANIRIGRDCWLERKDSFARYRSERPTGLEIGDRVRVFTWTAFNIEPSGAVEIGDDAVLVGAVFMCAESIRIGRRVRVSYHVTIADSDFHPRDPELRRLDAIANAPSGNREHRPAYVTSPVVIEDDVHIGIGAIILKGVYVGAGARIGAGAVVTANVPPGATVQGNPAQLVDAESRS
ncbi:MAG: acyltransferase [Pirellulales bacterium]|nr:acyltransferase [Pirellulales bacterium]